MFLTLVQHELKMTVFQLFFICSKHDTKSELGRQLNSILLSPNTSRRAILNFCAASQSLKKERSNMSSPIPLDFHIIFNHIVSQERRILINSILWNCPKYIRLNDFVLYQKSSGDPLRQKNFKESPGGCWDDLTAIVKYVVSSDSTGLV